MAFFRPGLKPALLSTKTIKTGDEVYSGMMIEKIPDVLI
jgi:hypothetical protein